MRIRSLSWTLLLLAAGSLAAAPNAWMRTLLAGPAEDRPTRLEPAHALAADEAVLTVVGVNDVHGQFLPTTRYDRKLGGLEWMAGHIEAIRAHSRRHYGDRGAVVLLDAGDAAQGTLLSNYSEGVAMSRAMNAMGFDAAIAGNHGYDFGPVGWTVDRVLPDAPDGDPLGALKRMVAAADFRFLGANVYRADSGEHLDWMPPYVLVPLPDGRQAAVIGLENEHTPSTTERSNVKGLRFGSGVEELTEIVEQLSASGEADVFLVTFHEGDGKTRSLRRFLEELPRRRDGQPLVDAVIAGHSHFRNDWIAGGIPYIQSQAVGAHLGMIQLLLRKHSASGRWTVDRERTRKQASVPIVPKKRRFMGEPVRPVKAVKAVVEEARREVAPIAERPIGTATGPFTRKGARIQDSLMGNMLADMMRAVARTEVAMINSGDVREGLPAGPLRYEQLFQALPKNLQLVTLPAVPARALVRQVWRSMESCGRRGALQTSGLVIEFSRDCDCPETDERGVDPEAKLLRLATTSGRLIYEVRPEGSWYSPDPVTVATSDFVLGGGAGYPAFRELQPLPDPPALRDAVARRMAARDRLDPRDFAPGRYINKGPKRCN